MENIKNLKKIKEMLHERNEYWWKEERPDLDLKYYVPTDIICDSLAYYERGLTEEEYKAIYGEEGRKKDTYFNTYDELDYFQNLDGAEYFGGDNTYNHSGNVQNDFQWHTIKLDDDVYIVLLAFHIGGDIRGNYTDYVVLEFDYEVGFEEFMGGEISYENGLGFELDVDGKNYDITPLVFDECVEVYDIETEDYIYGIWGNDDETVREMIRKKVIQNYMEDNNIITRDNSFLEIDSFSYDDKDRIKESKKNYNKWVRLLEKAKEHIGKSNKLDKEKGVLNNHIQCLLLSIKEDLNRIIKRSEKE